MSKGQGRKQAILGLIMVSPSFLLLLIVVVLPIAQSFVVSLREESGGIGLGRYAYLFEDKGMRDNLIFTLRITLVSCALVLAVSYAMALYMRFSDGRLVDWIRRTYMIPLFIPGVIATYGLMNLLGNHGWLSRFLLVFGIELPRIIFDQKGIIIANLWFNIPFATMLLSSAMAGIPASVIESARDVGAGKLAIFFRVIFPLSFKTFLVALTFVFMGVIGSFTAPFLLGPNAPQMLGVSMEQIFGVFREREQAAALAFFTFLLCSALGYFYIRSMAQEEASRS
ncbi:ABC transporter permease [Cohnella thailandensis]|uniref:ABC transporter permease subunit n=1 Tax=Cohnella thailandensis TaxID=557557 RepID=A0A841SX49_9BACL|nr:ABC transporter permease subunit [Cohnella thailandensis]MBB6633321.1 ABC transporter permease subunit [Cohnella thailandensis]MBP1977342.1 ABC-type spermidine/putrescine transport system permease subunit I [Cohnella thailandensis]